MKQLKLNKNFSPFSLCHQKSHRMSKQVKDFTLFYLFHYQFIFLLFPSIFHNPFVFLRQHNVRVDLVIQWPTEWIRKKTERKNQEEEFEKKLSIFFWYCFDISNAKWWMFWEFVQWFVEDVPRFMIKFSFSYFSSWNIF